MLSVHVNYLAVLISAAVYMAVGMLWYSKALFAKEWTKLTGKSQSDMKGSQKAMGFAILTSLLTAFVLARFITISGESTALGGAKIGLWLWLGFVATTHAVYPIFEGKPVKLYQIGMGYQLVSFLLMGAIIAAMG